MNILSLNSYSGIGVLSANFRSNDEIMHYYLNFSTGIAVFAKETFTLRAIFKK